MSEFKIAIITVDINPLTGVDETSQTLFENLSDAETYYNDEVKKDSQYRSTSIKLIRVIKRPY